MNYDSDLNDPYTRKDHNEILLTSKWYFFNFYFLLTAFNELIVSVIGAALMNYQTDLTILTFLTNISFNYYYYNIFV
jgi:hypothetical protein